MKNTSPTRVQVIRKESKIMVKAGKKYRMIRETAKTVTRFIATVTSVEDKGDHWYIGYTPDDFRVCRWGFCKVKKEGQYKAINYRLEEV